MNRKELEALKEYTNQRIIRVLDALQIDYNENYKYLTAPCPIHQGKKSSSFSWHLDYGVFQCFSRGCHEKFGKDVFGLIRGVLDCNFPAAVDFVEKVFEGDESLNIDELTQMKDNKKFVAREKKKAAVVFSEDLVSKLAYDAYLEARDYPRELVELYQAGVPSSKYKRMSNRIIFPVRDIEGKIVGFTGRTLLDNWKELNIGKWEHSNDFDKEHNLFNIDRAKKFIKETGIAILCEGPLDILRLEQAGIHNGVAIFGRVLHNGQISLLIQASANKLLIALDADIAGKSGAEGAVKTAQSFFSIETIDLGDGDVGDLTVNRVQEIFNDKCKI